MKTAKIFKYGVPVVLWLCLLCLFIPSVSFLGNGYVYDEERCTIDSAYSIRYGTSNVLIPPKIEAYKYNRRYIAARQNAYYSQDLYPAYIYPAGCDSIYYWIIDKSNKTCYGPMDSLRYIHVRDSLGVNLNFERKPFDWWHH